MTEIDIRRPIGALFLIIGALLLLQGFGAAAGGEPNRIWGAALILFGLAMLALSFWKRATRRDAAT